MLRWLRKVCLRKIYISVFLPSLIIMRPEMVNAGNIKPSVLNSILKSYQCQDDISTPYNSTCFVNEKLIRSSATPYIGTVHYKFGGTNPKTGMDCSAFTRMIFKKFGVRLKRTARQQALQGEYVHPLILRTGDLVFFDASNKRRGIDHVGLMLNPKEFIHCTSGKGVRIVQLSDYPHTPKFGRRIFQEDYYAKENNEE